MKKLFISLSILVLFSCLAGCASKEPKTPPQSSVTSTAPTSTSAPSDIPTPTETSAAADIKNIKIGYLTDRLGDNAVNDAFYSGAKRFMDETGLEITVIEHTELQDYEINARALCQEGYDLIFLPFNKAGEMMIELAKEFPDTHFYVQDTDAGLPNFTSYKYRAYEAAFLTGAFSVLMNQELGGDAKSAFIGGMRNPTLERAQYSYTAGSEYVGGKCTVVYVGSFTDLAKGKEVALQLYQEGHRFIQAYAGGTGTGVFQAAESLPEGYYALGEANGQFHLSDRIIASMVANMGDTTYSVLKDFAEGNLESGYKQIGYSDGAVSIVYSPGKEDLIPQNVKDKIKELEDKVISGEIECPTTEEEYNSFAKEFLNR